MGERPEQEQTGAGGTLRMKGEHDEQEKRGARGGDSMGTQPQHNAVSFAAYQYTT